MHIITYLRICVALRHGYTEPTTRAVVLHQPSTPASVRGDGVERSQLRAADQLLHRRPRRRALLHCDRSRPTGSISHLSIGINRGNFGLNLHSRFAQANDVYVNHPSSSGISRSTQQQQHESSPSMQANLHSSMHVGGLSSAAQQQQQQQQSAADLHVGQPAAAGPPMSAAKLYEVLNTFPAQLTDQYSLNQQPQIQQHLLQQQLSQILQGQQDDQSAAVRVSRCDTIFQVFAVCTYKQILDDAVFMFILIDDLLPADAAFLQLRRAEQQAAETAATAAEYIHRSELRFRKSNRRLQFGARSLGDQPSGGQCSGRRRAAGEQHRV